MLTGLIVSICLFNSHAPLPTLVIWFLFSPQLHCFKAYQQFYFRNIGHFFELMSMIPHKEPFFFQGGGVLSTT